MPSNKPSPTHLGFRAFGFQQANDYTKKNFNCLNPQHEDKTESAGWSTDGLPV